MRKLALVAIAAMFAATGTVSNASASLSSQDGTVWHPKSEMQVAARNDNNYSNDSKGDRGDRGGRDHGNRHGKKDKVIWRIRDKHHHQFFLFRGRGDCRTEAVKVRDGSGNLVVRNAWVCN